MAMNAVEKSMFENPHKTWKTRHMHDHEHRHFLAILMGLPPAEPEYCDRNTIIQKLNEMDRYVSTELRLCDTDKKFPQNEVFIVDDVYEMIEQLPPVQPEIIYCKDCKWYGRADKHIFYRGMDCLQKRINTIVPDRDFCSKAERREDG